MLSALVFSVYAVSRVNTYLVAGYDLGIFDQAVRSYAHFKAPIVTLKGDDYNIWADHFHPIIAAWAPLYWIWDNVRMLVIGQSLVVAAAVFPLWNFLRRHFTITSWAKVLTIAILMNWPIQGLIDFDVHEIAFAIPVLAWLLDALDRRRDAELVAACLLLLFVREDMGAIVFMTGLVRLIWIRTPAVPGVSLLSGVTSPAVPGALSPPAAASPAVLPGVPGAHPRRRRSDWAMGLGLSVGGLLVFALVTTVVIPHFATQGFQYWDYSVLDGVTQGIGPALLSLVKALLALVWPPMKLLTWLALLLPVGFLALRSPYALLALPIMAERMLGDRELLWTPRYHYNAPVWILIALAAVDAISRLTPGWAARLSSALHPVLRLRHQGTVGLREALAKLVAAVVIVGLAIGLTNLYRPISLTFPFQRLISGSAFRLHGDGAARAQVVAWLPHDTCVAADDLVAGQLTHTNRVTVPGVSQHRQDFYILDFANEKPATTPANWTTQESFAYAQSLGFEPVFQVATIVVLRAPDYAGPNPEDCGPGAS